MPVALWAAGKKNLTARGQKLFFPRPFNFCPLAGKFLGRESFSKTKRPEVLPQ